jgi:hypothetical protein
VVIARRGWNGIGMREDVVPGLQPRCVVALLVEAQRHLGPRSVECRAGVPGAEDLPVDKARDLDTAAPGLLRREFDVEAGALCGQLACGTERDDGATAEAIPLIAERDPVSNGGSRLTW